ATLRPGRMNRFECRFVKVKKRPAPKARFRNGRLRFRTEDLEVVVNAETGLLDRYRVGGVDFLTPGAVGFRMMRDDADPWGSRVRSFRKAARPPRLMTPEKAARFAGVSRATLAPVRVIEDGPVRVVVEALFSYGDSAFCQRYKLPREGTEVEVETRVLWQEKDRMLKLCLPTPWYAGNLRGQVAYGAQEMAANGEEVVAQKWLAVLSDDGRHALTVVNDATYGCDFLKGELRLSVLRGPAYAAHPTGPGRSLVREDRLTPRLDQGEHVFHFWLNAGLRSERLTRVDREALAHAERPFALAYWPPGGGDAPAPGPVLSDPAVQITAFKKAEGRDELIVRLFEPTGKARRTTLTLPHLGLTHSMRLGPFEIRTLAVDPSSRQVREVSLMEEA
ncbi:MAG: alpha-mannosidase, partial [Gemmatimonadetes bacterium]|nr:alpha-mannosidase [Gemmatimonadota bacterium]